MIIVADSGSTKTDWVLIDDNGEKIQSIRTVGFNPYFQTSDFIHQTLKKAFESFKDLLGLVSEVNYYGAGCSSPDKNEIVEYALSKLFINADITVGHDMVAASRATLNDTPGIACIIGTGSNTCVWNGFEITDNIPSHGYIFGDEGSGSYLGIELLKVYLSGEMSKELKASFDSEFDISEDDILNRVYKGVNPNVYLASFASFYSKHPEDKTLTQIIEKGFDLFFQTRVIKYDNHQSLKLGFVGSIAYHFSTILHSVAKKYNMEIQNIAKCPIDNLVMYHSTKKVA